MYFCKRNICKVRKMFFEFRRTPEWEGSRDSGSEVKGVVNQINWGTTACPPSVTSTSFTSTRLGRFTPPPSILIILGLTPRLGPGPPFEPCRGVVLSPRPSVSLCPSGDPRPPFVPPSLKEKPPRFTCPPGLQTVKTTESGPNPRLHSTQR